MAGGELLRIRDHFVRGIEEAGGRIDGGPVGSKKTCGSLRLKPPVSKNAELAIGPVSGAPMWR
jgi:hypothetical protein